MKLTQEQIIAWAREAGWQYAEDDNSGYEPLWKAMTLAYEAGRNDERKRITDLIRSDRYGIGSMMSQWTNEDVAEDIEDI